MRTVHSGALLSLALLVSVLFACKGVKDLISDDKASAASSAAVAPSAPAPVATASNEVTFVKAVPKAGTKENAKSHSNVKFTFQGQVIRSTEETSVDVEVQNADEFRVTKAALDVKELYTTNQQGTGNETKSVSPLAGSRFVVTRGDDGKLSALDGAGSKVAAPQRTLLEKHFGTIFERDKTREFLPNRPVKIGEKLIPSSDAVLGLLGQKDDGKSTVDGVEFILRTSTPDKATFAVSLTFTQKLDGGIRLRAKLDGTIDVRPKDSEVVNVSLKGPLALLDAQGNEKGTGDLGFNGEQTPL
jgi:hypothetical protein